MGETTDEPPAHEHAWEERGWFRFEEQGHQRGLRMVVGEPVPGGDVLRFMRANLGAGRRTTRAAGAGAGRAPPRRARSTSTRATTGRHNARAMGMIQHDMVIAVVDDGPRVRDAVAGLRAALRPEWAALVVGPLVAPVNGYAR
jgi:hypothetical protein